MSSTTGTEASALLGRSAEVRQITAMLDGIEEAGAALVLRGEPGIGKSRLLEHAVDLARARDITVLSTAGVQSEARIGFAGLHQLVRPIRADAEHLLPDYRAALDAAFGIGDETAPALFRIAMATLDLLSEVASRSPLLVLAEDAHWLDRASSDVLTFVARRIASDPIVVLAAERDGYRSSLVDVGLPELRVGPLDPVAATELLDTTTRPLRPAQRDRVLREAAGNPLALIELPAAVTEHDEATPPGLLPLTERLELAFAARVAELPQTTRLLLLVAALNDADDLNEALDAGSGVAGERLGAEQLQPAAEAAIVDLDERTVRFRHPLVRSAIRDHADVGLRRRVHEALADRLSAQPERFIWHRAALISGPHEDLAAMLDHAGRQAQRRGAMAVASSAFRRAAELSEPAQRNRRLLAAAQRAYELGRPDLALPLLREVADHHPAPLERARATWVEEMIDPRPLEDEERVGALLAAAAEAGEAGDRELQIDLVWLVAQRAWWVDPGPDARRLLINAADRLGDAGSEDLRVLAIYAYADPFGHAAAVVERLRIAAHSNRRTIQPDAARHLGPAALVAGAFDLGKPLLDAAADGLRLEGRLGHLPRILALQSISAAWLADWDRAIPAAAEARRLAEELRDTLWAAGGDVGASLIAGIRGDADVVREASARAERIGTAARANFMVALAQLGPVIAALGESRHADALARAQRLFDPGDSAYHPVMCSWLISELAEAALHLNRLDEGRARLADVEKTAGRSPGNGIEVGLRHARALLADDCEAEACFEHALDARLGSWPFQHARIKLAYGQWLRRRRRIAESRTPLRTARDAFDELGCAAWADQARRELRASGESSRRRTPDARDQLTAQELQIAHLAAQGLSNRQIGQRLYLSHRTVGTHLYRIFPKLGITARTELSSALSND